MIIPDKKTGKIPVGSICIGCGSRLGNPYSMDESGDREDVPKVYGLYLNKEVDRKNPIILRNSASFLNKPVSCHLNTYQFNENVQYVIPAGIAGIQKPRMARP